MCHWRRAKPDSSRTTVDEEEQQGYRYQAARQSIDDDRASTASRRTVASQHAAYPVPVQAKVRDQYYQSSLPPLPPSTGSLNRSQRMSLSSSIKSYSTIQSYGMRHDSAPLAAGPKAREVGGTANFIETLPNEVLEDIFLFAISSSFPIEDPNWPLVPMFSKRSYHHSPSNSGSGYNPHMTNIVEGGTRSRSGSGGRTSYIPTPELLAAAPHLLPTVLSQTCRRFRMILRNASHLWSYINITRTVSPMQGQQPLMARQLLGWLPIYLARARDTGLHITFDTTKFASFSAPLSMAMAAPSSSPLSTSTEVIHPQSIIAILLPALARWTSITILTSHVGSPTLNPLLHLLSGLRVPNLNDIRVAADIWRPGIVGYGAPLPALLAGGTPRLRSVILEGVHLDWKSCAGVDTSRQGPGLFSTLRNLELRFIGGRYPRWEQFAILLQQGCPNLERLVVRDDFDEALRAIDPPTLPYFEELEASQKAAESPTSPQYPTSTRSSGSHMSENTSSSLSARIPSHIASLHLTLPPQSGSGSMYGGRVRSHSVSSNSSGSSGSSSSSSSPTSPYYQHFQHHPRQPRRQREFRKIELPSIRHLEVDAFNASAGALRNSRSNLALQGKVVSTSSSTVSHGGAGGSKVSPPPLARFLYLLATPNLESLAVGGLVPEEWVHVADMLGLPRHIRRFNGSGGSSRELGKGVSVSGGDGQRVYPFLNHLEVDLVDV